MLPTPHTPQADLSAIDRASLRPSTREKYKAAVLAMIAARVNPLDTQALTAYTASLPTSGRAHLKAGLSVLYRDLVRSTKAGATPANVAQVTAILYRIDAMQDTIKVNQPEPERMPHWLTQSQVDRILAAALAESIRDYIALALLIGAGLRREEAAALTWDAVTSIDARPVLRVRGKGDKVRIVPLPAAIMDNLNKWRTMTGPGPILRRVSKAGKIGPSLSAKGIFDLVRRYGAAALDIPDLDPHDLRRTYGRLIYQKSHDIILVKDLLGHADVKTTQRYIGIQHHTTAPEIIRHAVTL